MVRGRNVDLARVLLDRSIVDLRARYAHDRDPRLRRVRRDEETVSGQRACTKVRRSDTFWSSQSRYDRCKRSLFARESLEINRILLRVFC